MMKGLFRGLRCIFDTDDEKEPEIQIGNPTDVKHVAHIGCDGPSTPAPSWMNEYQSGSDSQSGDKNAASKDLGAAAASPSRPAKTRQSKRQTTSSSLGNSDSSENPNHKPRKSKTSNGDTAANDASRTRKIKSSILGSESQAQDQSVKKTRKKKGESTRSSKTKNKDADSGCSDGVCKKPID